MNQLILCVFIFVYLYSFTNEKIDINPNSGLGTLDIKETLADIELNNNINILKSAYGFNVQNCKRRVSSSCYVSLYLGDNCYYFCGTIEDTLYGSINEEVKNSDKEFIEAYRDKICENNATLKTFFEKEIGDDKLNKKFKIDCFSQKLRFLSLLTLICSILLL